MPLYEYECAEHGRFEMLHVSPTAKSILKVKDGKLTVCRTEAGLPEAATCPKCGKCSPRLVSAHARTPGRWAVGK